MKKIENISVHGIYEWPQALYCRSRFVNMCIIDDNFVRTIALKSGYIFVEDAFVLIKLNCIYIDWLISSTSSDIVHCMD